VVMPDPLTTAVNITAWILLPILKAHSLAGREAPSQMQASNPLKSRCGARLHLDVPTPAQGLVPNLLVRLRETEVPGLRFWFQRLCIGQVTGAMPCCGKGEGKKRDPDLTHLLVCPDTSGTVILRFSRSCCLVCA
jgi:hypothetical protein